MAGPEPIGTQDGAGPDRRRAAGGPKRENPAAGRAAGSR